MTKAITIITILALLAVDIYFITLNTRLHQYIAADAQIIDQMERDIEIKAEQVAICEDVLDGYQEANPIEIWIAEATP